MEEPGNTWQGLMPCSKGEGFKLGFSAIQSQHLLYSYASYLAMLSLHLSEMNSVRKVTCSVR